MNVDDRQRAMDRPSFLKVSLLASGALVIGIGCEGSSQANVLEMGVWKPNLYVRIDVDGKITIVSKKPGRASRRRSRWWLRNAWKSTGKMSWLNRRPSTTAMAGRLLEVATVHPTAGMTFVSRERPPAIY